MRYYSEISDGNPRIQEMGTLAPVNQLGTNTYTVNAKMIQNKLKDYFSSEVGAIAFQYDNLF